VSDGRRWIDLHLHTTASDGAYPPDVVVRWAAQRGLSAIAFTDHDTLAGYEEGAAAARSGGIELIAGVELAARWGDRTLDLLGYGFDPANARLAEALGELRRLRADRNRRMLARLRELGIDLAEDALRGRAASAGRPHVADLLVERGVVPDRKAAFVQYLGRGQPAFVPRDVFPAAETIALIRGAGGIVALAHPSQAGTASPPELETLVRRLADLGMAALEVYHPDHTDAQTRQYVGLAKGCGLRMTGGSDYHGIAGVSPPRCGVGFAPLRVPYELLTALRG